MKILHIADVHVRTGVSGRARRAEYLEVIDNLVKLGREIGEPIMSTVVGDVLHDRTALDPHALHVFRALMKGLASLGPVVVVQGNHDHHPQHACPDAPHDVLGELISLADVPGVVYLEKSGHYVVDGVGFGVVTVHDSVPEGEARSGQAAPDFPFPAPVEGIKNVALFHGALQGSRNDGGSVKSGVRPDWFEGYDAVMLGDQHVQQIGNHEVEGGVMRVRPAGHPGGPTWAYPGSLVQQSHGESLWNHGAVVWDLEERTVRPAHVRCSHGFVTLRGDCLLYDGAWQQVSKHVADPDFPRTVDARCKDDASVAVAALEAAGVAVAMTRSSLAQPGSSVAEKPDARQDAALDWRVCLREHLDVDAAIEASYVPTFAEPGLAGLAATRNARLEKLGRAAVSGGPTTKARLRPTCLRWDGLLCYGEGNEAAFLADRGVVLVSGCNGAGKTAFLEILLLALFGEGFPSRSCGSAAVINVERQEACSEVDIELGGEAYRISRKWTRSAKDGTRASTKAELHVMQGAQQRTLCKGRAAVDDWIAENVCTVADFLSGPMLSQTCDNDALSLSGRECAALLERAYGLSGIDALGELLGEASNALKQVVSKAESIGNGVTREDFDEARSRYKAAKKASVTLKERLSRVANPARPSDKQLRDAEVAVKKLAAAGDHDPWAHVRDVQALSAVTFSVVPTDDQTPEGSGEVPMAFGTVASLWTRYSQSVGDLGRYGLVHKELLARPELVKDLGRDASADVDYGAEIDRLAREDARLRAVERADQKRLDSATSALSDAEEAHSDAVAHSLRDRYGECCAEWESTIDRTRIVLGYLTHAGQKMLPRADALTDTVAIRTDVLEAQTFDEAAAAMGIRVPTTKGAKASGTVPDCARAVAGEAAKLAATRALMKDVMAKSAAAQDALRRQVLEKTDEDALDALRTLETAWAPLRGVDLEGARQERAAEERRLVDAVAAHEAAKMLSEARDVVIAAGEVAERAEIQAKLDDLDLDRRAMEWGRVRGCEAILGDSAAVDACRARLQVVVQAAAKLKGLKTWLYSERIAPEISSKANAVISRVAPDLAIACVVSEDGTVSWTINDAGLVVSPQRASGFQRFMASMALRIVFGDMLAPCSLLVVDEGFTACDRDHLARVPAFLEWLVQTGRAGTVLLVSHLTEIREHVGKVVDLVRGRPLVA